MTASQGPSWRALLGIAVLVAAWSAIGVAARATHGAHTTADEPHYLLSAISLGEDQNLNVADELRDQRYRTFHQAELPIQEQQRADGSAVSPHDPGLPALLALPTLVGGWIAAKLGMAILAGILAAATVWVAVRRFDVPMRAATIVVLACACAAPLAVYGTQIYPEIPAALAVMIAIGAVAGELDTRAAVVATIALAVLPWLAIKYVPVVAVLAAFAAWKLLRASRPRALAFAGALGLAGVAFLAAHHAWYGGVTAYASGSHFQSGEFTVVGNDPDYSGRALRLVGLLVDRNFGIAAWQPAYLLCIPALAALAVKRPRNGLLLALPLAADWFTATFVALTMNGWWFPGRQLVVVLPVAMLLLAWWAAARPLALKAIAALGVLAASLYAWLVAQTIWGHITLVVDFNGIAHPLLRAWRVVLPDYRVLGTRDWILHGAWIALIAVVTWREVRAGLRAHRFVPERGRSERNERNQPEPARVRGTLPIEGVATS